jgi:hypothetical protein
LKVTVSGGLNVERLDGVFRRNAWKGSVIIFVGLAPAGRWRVCDAGDYLCCWQDGAGGDETTGAVGWVLLLVRLA